MIYPAQRHPARRMSFDDLLAGLERARAGGAVNRRYDPPTGLSLWIYSGSCVYDDLWNEFSLIARGLILHEGRREVVATPFPKFFNAGERQGTTTDGTTTSGTTTNATVPDGPFEAFEKLDGSLVILFRFDGRWRTATKGAFASEQARWALTRLASQDLASDALGELAEGATYLLEATYRENRVVVLYPEPALVLLAAYGADGLEMSYEELLDVGRGTGWPVAERHAFASVIDMIAHAETMPSTREGFVVRYADGFRLKIKGAEYRRIHALISRCTPLALWEVILADEDGSVREMEATRRLLPEEYWGDFDAIRQRLEAAVANRKARLAELAAETAHLSDKELGLTLKTYPTDMTPYLFGWRKGGWDRVRAKVVRAVRPTGNVLYGYTPSYAITRVIEDTG